MNDGNTIKEKKIYLKLCFNNGHKFAVVWFTFTLINWERITTNKNISYKQQQQHKTWMNWERVNKGERETTTGKTSVQRTYIPCISDSLSSLRLMCKQILDNGEFMSTWTQLWKFDMFTHVVTPQKMVQHAISAILSLK